MANEPEQVKMTVSIPTELHRRAKIRAAEDSLELRTLVIEGLELRLMQKSKKGGDRR